MININKVLVCQLMSMLSNPNYADFLHESILAPLYEKMTRINEV